MPTEAAQKLLHINEVAFFRNIGPFIFLGVVAGIFCFSGGATAEENPADKAHESHEADYQTLGLRAVKFLEKKRTQSKDTIGDSEEREAILAEFRELQNRENFTVENAFFYGKLEMLSQIIDLPSAKPFELYIGDWRSHDFFYSSKGSSKKRDELRYAFYRDISLHDDLSAPMYLHPFLLIKKVRLGFENAQNELHMFRRLSVSSRKFWNILAEKGFPTPHTLKRDASEDAKVSSELGFQIGPFDTYGMESLFLNSLVSSKIDYELFDFSPFKEELRDRLQAQVPSIL